MLASPILELGAERKTVTSQPSLLSEALGSGRKVPLSIQRDTVAFCRVPSLGGLLRDLSRGLGRKGQFPCSLTSLSLVLLFPVLNLAVSLPPPQPQLTHCLTHTTK